MFSTEFIIFLSVFTVLITSILICIKSKNIAVNQVEKTTDDNISDEKRSSKTTEAFYMWSTFGYIGCFLSVTVLILITLSYLRIFELMQNTSLYMILAVLISSLIYYGLFIILIFLPQIFFPNFGKLRLLVLGIGWFIFEKFTEIWIFVTNYLDTNYY